MSVTFPTPKDIGRVVKQLDALATRLPPNPDALSDYAKWTRFAANPAITNLMPPQERVRFIAEMRTLKEKYGR